MGKLSQTERNRLWRLRHPERYQAKQQRDYARRRRERAAYEWRSHAEVELEGIAVRLAYGRGQLELRGLKETSAWLEVDDAITRLRVLLELKP